jgi:hypothetical protein
MAWTPSHIQGVIMYPNVKNGAKEESEMNSNAVGLDIKTSVTL